MIRTLGFNPRAHGGRDLEINARGGTRYNVSIHAPTGGATSSGSTSATMKRFQSTRPWGGATFECWRDFVVNAPVSIHAPMGGATRHGGDASLRDAVSIHAPTGGATCKWTRKHNVDGLFQSTRPRGARLRLPSLHLR